MTTGSSVLLEALARLAITLNDIIAIASVVCAAVAVFIALLSLAADSPSKIQSKGCLSALASLIALGAGIAGQLALMVTGKNVQHIGVLQLSPAAVDFLFVAAIILLAVSLAVPLVRSRME